MFDKNLTRYYFQRKLQTDKMRKHMDQNQPPLALENDTAHPWRHMVDTRSVISDINITCRNETAKKEVMCEQNWFKMIQSWKTDNYLQQIVFNLSLP